MFNTPVDPLAAALELVGRGVPVFPCNPQTKAPLLGQQEGGRGHLDASTDPGQVRAWWDRWGGRVLWGVPTGSRTGIAVFDVDCDRDKGVDGYATLRERQIAPPKTRAHLTPRGGMHLIYRLGEGEAMPTDAGRLGPGLDRRGDGGYVIWYPAHGGTIVEAMEPQPAPSWLTVPVRTGKDAVRVVDAKQAEAILQAAVHDVVQADHGEHNATLSRSGFILGQLVQAGLCEPERAGSLLLEAVSDWPNGGKTKSNALRVIEKALRRGAENPGFESVDTAVFRAFGDKVQWTPRGLLEDFNDIVERPSNPEWLIDGVIECGVNALMHGQPNAGKSFILIDWCLSIASGTQWCERDTRAGAVVYMLGEGHRGFYRRLTAWKADRKVSLARGAFRVLRKAIALNNAPDLEGVCAEIDKGPRPVLIVIDTKMRFTPGWDENAPVDTGRYVALVGGLMERYGCAVLTVHHTGKSSGTAMGHNSLRGAVDNEWSVAGEGAAPHRTCVLTVTKLKDGEAAGPMRFAFCDVELPWFDGKGRRVHSAVVRWIKGVEGTDRDGQAGGDGAGPGVAGSTVRDGPGPRFTANDRLMLQAMGMTDAAQVSDRVIEYKVLKDTFVQLHGSGDVKARRKIFERAFNRALERNWFDDRDDLVTPNKMAIIRDLGHMGDRGQ